MSIIGMRAVCWGAHLLNVCCSASCVACTGVAWAETDASWGCLLVVLSQHGLCYPLSFNGAWPRPPVLKGVLIRAWHGSPDLNFFFLLCAECAGDLLWGQGAAGPCSVGRPSELEAWKDFRVQRQDRGGAARGRHPDCARGADGTCHAGAGQGLLPAAVHRHLEGVPAQVGALGPVGQLTLNINSFLRQCGIYVGHT